MLSRLADRVFHQSTARRVRSSASLAPLAITIAIASGGGTLNGTLTATTNADGIATFSAINVTGTAGQRTFTITGTGLTALTTPAITFN